MKRINMTKYGFIRTPANDFGDDGNRFTTYLAGSRVEVTKCVSDGEAYIDAAIHGTKLPYDVYSVLPHYPIISKLNGVSCAALTDQDLKDLYEACLLYEREYTAAENTINMPTLADLQKQCKVVQEKRETEQLEASTAIGLHITELALALTEWEWKDLRGYLRSLTAQMVQYDPNTYPNSILDKARSIDFCRPDCAEMQPSFYYKKLMELVARVR